jgi:predicted molibdopterin-dependent oxidoreductase YjgC
MRTVGVERWAMVVPRGRHDEFLIKAEKAANGRGARELGLVSGDDDGLNQLLDACEKGEIKGLYVCSDDFLELVDAARLSEILPQMDLLIAHTLKFHPMLTKAAVIFPTTTFAEKEGTFTNHAGRVQRIRKVLEPPAGWLTDGEIFTEILNHLQSRQEHFDLPGIWESMARNGTPFGQLTFDRIDPNGALLENSD